MTEINDQAPEVEKDSTSELNHQAEMEALKQRAKIMGLRISPNIGLEALRNKVNAAISSETQEDNGDDGESSEDEDGNPAAPRKETRQQIRDRLRRDKLKLVRCRITCMNPSKAELAGEIFCVGNKYIGEVKKFVPYGEATDNGYHIPQILFDMLKNKQFLQIRSRRVKGQIKVETKWVNEFALEVLPPLKPEELAKLAQDQRAGNRIGDD